jgi:hypothetical protein
MDSMAMDGAPLRWVVSKWKTSNGLFQWSLMVFSNGNHMQIDEKPMETSNDASAFFSDGLFQWSFKSASYLMI